MVQQALLRDSPTLFRRALLTAVALVVLAGIGWRIARVFTPPPLAVAAPADALATTGRIVTISGTTAPGAAITINGAAYAPDPAGAFRADVVLLPGVNTIVIESRLRHSRPARIERRVVVHASEAPLAGA